MTFDSSGNAYFVANYGPASSPTTPLYWKSATSTPIAMTMPAGTTIFNIGMGAAGFDGSGNFIVAGNAGNTVSGFTITDGVPVYWQNGNPINLPMGSGNTWGQAGLLAVGP